MPSGNAWKIPQAFYTGPVGSATPWCHLIDEMLIKLFVLHNEPTGHSLFLVNFKRVGQPEFVLTFLTPKCLLSLSDLMLIFSEMEPFLFFPVSSYFPKRCFWKWDRQEKHPMLVCFKLSIYRTFPKSVSFGIVDRGFHLNLLWKAMEFDEHFEHFCECLLCLWLCSERVRGEAGFVLALAEFKI